jgi:DNA-binding NtrC family response regulator
MLDEVSELPLPLQVTLLRALEQREVVPLGGTRAIPVDLRLCAASNVDLAERVDSGRFRGDLFARLGGFSLQLPSLRQRREDLGLLIGALIRRLSRAPEQVRLTAAAARALLGYRWPLNIRELEKCLGAALVLANGAAIDVQHLPRAIHQAPAGRPDGEAPVEPARVESETDRHRRTELARLLAEHGGNISAVARAMGKQRMQIRRWIRRLGLDPR